MGDGHLKNKIMKNNSVNTYKKIVKLKKSIIKIKNK